MYAIYGNIYHQYTPNVSIYSIHGSYGNVKEAHFRLKSSWNLIQKNVSEKGTPPSAFWSVRRLFALPPCQHPGGRPGRPGRPGAAVSLCEAGRDTNAAAKWCRQPALRGVFFWWRFQDFDGGILWNICIFVKFGDCGIDVCWFIAINGGFFCRFFEKGTIYLSHWWSVLISFYAREI